MTMKVRQEGKKVVIECSTEFEAKQTASGVEMAFSKMSVKKMATAGKLFSKRLEK